MARGGGLAATLKRQQLKTKALQAQASKIQKQEQAKKNSRAKATGAKFSKHVPVTPWLGFEPTDRVLLIGEGDFSFACSLVKQQLAAHVTSTSLDDEATLLEKYPNTVPENLEYLRASPDTAVLHFGIDGTTLEKSKALRRSTNSFDVCIFNFPHLGNSVKDQDRNILQHQQLMLAFFKSCQSMIKPTGRVLVALFDSEPYNSWTIRQLARSTGLQVLRTGQFHWDSFDGYNHRLTAKEGQTSKPQSARPARIYVFKLVQPEPEGKPKKPKKVKHDSDSDSD